MKNIEGKNILQIVFSRRNSGGQPVKSVDLNNPSFYKNRGWDVTVIEPIKGGRTSNLLIFHGRKEIKNKAPWKWGP